MEHVTIKTNLELYDFDDIFKNLNAAIIELASFVIDDALKSDGTYAYFPIEWDFCNSDGVYGKSVSDPLTMYLRIDTSADDEPPTFSFSLSEVVDSFIEGAMDHTINLIDNDGQKKSAKALSDGFRDLADKLDKACSP